MCQTGKIVETIMEGDLLEEEVVFMGEMNTDKKKQNTGPKSWSWINKPCVLNSIREQQWQPSLNLFTLKVEMDYLKHRTKNPNK